MPFEASWLKAPDFTGVMEAGARLGLSRQQMLQEAGQHAADLALRASAANADRQQAQAQFTAAQALKEGASEAVQILEFSPTSE